MRLFIFWLCICSGLLACESSKNVFYEAEREVGYDNGGKYVITRFKNPSLGDSAVIFGAFSDIEKKDDYFYGVRIWIDNQYLSSLREPAYHYKEKLIAGSHQIKAFYISYESIEIKNLELNPGDSVRIDFYLKELDSHYH